MMKSLKCIICKTTYNTTYIHTYSFAIVDYRGAAAPKKKKKKINEPCDFIGPRLQALGLNIDVKSATTPV